MVDDQLCKIVEKITTISTRELFLTPFSLRPPKTPWTPLNVHYSVKWEFQGMFASKMRIFLEFCIGIRCLKLGKKQFWRILLSYRNNITGTLSVRHGLDTMCTSHILAYDTAIRFGKIKSSIVRLLIPLVFWNKVHRYQIRRFTPTLGISSKKNVFQTLDTHWYLRP